MKKSKRTYNTLEELERVADKLVKMVSRKLKQRLDESLRFQRLLDEMETSTSALRAISNELERLLEIRKETEKTCDKISQKLSRARNLLAKKIEALSYGTIDQLCDLIGFDLRKITKTKLKILQAILDLEKSGEETHLTNISEGARIRRDVNLERLLDEMVHDGLLVKHSPLIQAGERRGRPARAIYKIPEHIQQLLDPSKGRESPQIRLLSAILDNLREKSYLALALPQKPGKSIPDGIAIPFEDGELNWKKILAVEVESPDEVGYKIEHIAKILAKRLSQGYAKVILAYYGMKRGKDVEEALKKELKRLYPEQWQEIIKRTQLQLY